MLDQEPDAGLGNGGLGRLAACFLESMATLELPAMGYGLRYEFGMFRQSIANGWQREEADNWLRRTDPWEVHRRADAINVHVNCSFAIHNGTVTTIPNRPSTLEAIPYDRPVVGYGGKTINTLRLWAAGGSELFDFQEFSHGDFVNALASKLVGRVDHARALSRRLDERRDKRCAFSRSTSWSRPRSATSCAGSAASTIVGKTYPTKSRSR